jgi:serine/threonine-protein kinase
MTRCKVSGSRAGESKLEGEIADLLLRRLRIVTLIALLPSFLFLVRNLFDPPPMPHREMQLGLILHTIVNVLMAVIALYLFVRPTHCLYTLRGIELVLFGTLAGYFGWLQFSLFCQAELFKAGELVRRTLVVGSSIRWFFLIVIYGVFIPNTWKRCSIVVGIGALLPMIVTPISAAMHGLLTPAVTHALPDLAIAMITGVTVAVFGSYRLRFLQQQAFEAQQLGQYRLKRRLGTGGMGEVYLAEHVLLRRPCAIKLIRPDRAQGETFDRFEREVQAMATLTHWNTVEIFDYGHAEDGTFYYVMEYLPGPTLEALVKQHGPVPAARAIHFLRQVCAALREAHGIGLLHRDIKPTNILICERGGVRDVAKLLDFGLVQDAGLGKEAMRLTVQGTVLGSPPYMSPEQAASRPNLDARTDIYSLGGVAYFLVTGQAPFPRDSAMEMLLAHAYEPALPPTNLRPEIPLDLEAIILRCLSKRPDERYSNVVELDQALAACADAGEWTEERAADWWQGKPAIEEMPAAALVPTTR